MQATKIRINDLARELEVKSKVILDILAKVGVTEKKTHSSSIEVDEAELVKKYHAEHGEPGSSRSSRSQSSDEFRPKIDLSHISKPGDVLKLITKQQQAPAAPPARPVTAPVEAKPVASAPPTASTASSAPPTPSAAPQAARPAMPPAPAPRFITPQSVARPVVRPPVIPATPSARRA